MPGKPGRYCPHCGGLATGSRCACRARVSTQLDGPENRPTSAQRGYGYRWQKYRANWFRRNPNAVCTCGCGAHVTMSNGDLDHDPPLLHGREDPRLLDDASIRPYLHAHHSRKTGMYDHTRGRV